MQTKEKRTKKYTDYLLSEAWRLKRGIVIRACGFQCQRCGQKHDFRNRLQVHHYTYKNLGNEPIEDLVTLCKACHKIADKERLTNPTKRYIWKKTLTENHKASQAQNWTQERTE